MNDWLNALFSITDGALSASEKIQLATVGASWVLLNDRLGKFFVDVIGPRTQLQAIQDRLVALGRNPIVIGVFDSNGVLQGTANKTEWLNVARDVKTYDAQGNLLTTTRPAAYIDLHRWSGWAGKVIA